MSGDYGCDYTYRMKLAAAQRVVSEDQAQSEGLAQAGDADAPPELARPEWYGSGR